MSDLCFLTAVELADRIRRRQVSVTEVVRAHLAQIERVNPRVNAIVTLTAERALDDAAGKDTALARGDAPGPLFGLPIAHKDLVPTKGIRTTLGSPIYRDHVPTVDGLIIERLRAAGAVTLGKTNTPEFGAGSALLLSAMAGPDPRSPIAITQPGEMFRRPLERDFRGVRVAWSRDLGGLPIDRRVTAALEPQRKAFETLGCVVEDGEPDLSDAREIFQALRALSFVMRFGTLLAEHRHQIKDTVIWNTEQGLKLTARELGEAEVKRTALYHRVRQFMERHEFLVLPVTQVPPFDVTQPYVTEIEGVRLPTYIDWMRACSDITVTGHPAISVPGGFTPEGLPVGLQIVGRHQDEWSVLQLAHAFEQATGVGRRRPSLAI